MERYGIKMIFQFLIENESRILYVESIRLFHANSFDNAFKKAENYAVTLYDEYTNIYGQKVTYKLLDTVESFLMHEEISFEDGAEIFSSIFESEDLFKLRYTRCSVADMYIIRRL